MKALFAVICILLLAGCCKDYAGFDSSWLDPCEVVAPPDRVEYSKANDEEQKVMWLEVYVKQAKVNELCNSRLAKARPFLQEVQTGGDLK